MNQDGTAASERLIGDGAGGFTGQLQPGDTLGTSVSAIGDLDGDGVVDLAAGAHRTGSDDKGAVWILFLEGAPVTGLRWSTAAGFSGVDGVEPNQGLPGQPFEFRVDYVDADGLMPQSGFPKLLLDLNADGDTFDSGEGEYVMLELDQDSDVTDGKTYFYPTNLPDPGFGAYRYSFRARNTDGVDAIGAPTQWKSGPVVQADLYDLAIYANDILFSDLHPMVGEAFDVTIRFRNDSNFPVNNVLVVVESDGEPIFSGTVAHVDPHGTGQATFEWAYGQEGFYGLRAFVDPDEQFDEWNELNNDATRPIVVGEYTLPGSIEVTGIPLDLTYQAGTTLGFSGLARYLGTGQVPEPLVQGASVTFTPTWRAAQSTTTNSAGSFSFSIPGPTTSGEYLIHVLVTDYTLTREFDIALHATPAPAGPDLSIALVASPSTPCVGTASALTWWVTNVGNQPSPAATALLEEPGAGTISSQSVDSLAPGQTVVLTGASVMSLVAGTRTFSARVDPLNVVAELSEGNNLATTAVTAYADCFEWDPGSIGLSRATPCAGQAVTISVPITNWGCQPAPATTVRFKVNNALVAELPFDALAGKGQSRQVSLHHVFSAAGSYAVSFEVDPDGLAAECNNNNANNFESTGVTVVVCGSVDYQVDACSITAINSAPVANELVTFRASVRNGGSLAGTGPVAVRFLLDGVPFGADVLTSGALAAGASQTVTSAMAWSVDFLPHLLEVRVDPDNLAQGEGSEVNNQASCVMPYDLQPVPIALCPPSGPRMFETCSPCTGVPMQLFAQVINSGLFDVTGAVSVQFEDRFTGSPVSFGSTEVTNLRGRGSCSPASIAQVTASHAFVELGAHAVTFVVDATSQWPEYSESNNSYGGSVLVQDCSPQPDLYILSQHINPEVINPVEGREINWIKVTVSNSGSVPAPAVVDVLIDGVVVCNDVSLGVIAGGGSYTEECQIDVPGEDDAWTAPYGPPFLHVIQVAVDPDSLIAESSETNNLATRSMVVGPAPDLYLSAGEIVRSMGSANGELRVLVRVGNAGEVAGSGLLNLSTLGTNGQYTLVQQVPIFLPDAASNGAQIWVEAAWLTNSPEVRVRATLTGVSPQDFDETNNTAERLILNGPRARPRRQG